MFGKQNTVIALLNDTFVGLNIARLQRANYITRGRRSTSGDVYETCCGRKYPINKTDLSYTS